MDEHQHIGDTRMPRRNGALAPTLWLVALLLGAGPLGGSPVLGSERADQPPQSGNLEGLAWELVGASVLKAGQLSTNAAGIVLSDYAIQAIARGTNGGRLSNGVFHLSLNAFCPRTNQHALKAGQWQIKGTWTVVEKPARQAGHSASAVQSHPEYLQGYLLGELDACPTAIQARFSAAAWAEETQPLTPRAKYEGSFDGQGKFEGWLRLKAAAADSATLQNEESERSKGASSLEADATGNMDSSPEADGTRLLNRSVHEKNNQITK